MAGSAAGAVRVLVRDANGAGLAGVMVSFTVSVGGGSVRPVAAITGEDGVASTVLTVGTVLGPNQVTATVEGLAPVSSILVSGLAGPSALVAISPRTLRFTLARTSEFITAVARDRFGNATGIPIAWTSRNPGLVSVSPSTGGSINVQVMSRPGQAWVVGTAGPATDSLLVSVLDANSTPCTYAASPTVLMAGESMSLEADAPACVRSEDAGVEYALISHFGSAAGTVFATVEVTPTGIVSLTPDAGSAADGPVVPRSTQPSADEFEHQLRGREQIEMGPRVAGARSWFGSQPPALVRTLREGDYTTANVNAFDFCANADTRTARVASVTGTAVILADTLNPPGGFSDAEYRAFGLMMDTLVSPLSAATFGSPTDVDGNGRVAILFTGAVNELTPVGSTSGIVLGFFYSRDLLPRESATSLCPGSNVSEMFYVLVPDPAGALSDARSKEFVQSLVVGTLVHEYQHLINASRRLYVNNTPSPNEELWLNEGLSHVAEELLFYKASQLSPRQNLGAAALTAGSAAREAFDSYGRSNVARYTQYLRAPELNSPISTEDFLGTRGATWSFLRYLADHAGSTDGDLWYRVVNSRTTGIANLDQALSGKGLSTLGLMHDWSTSVLLDDQVPSLQAAFQQPSWDFVTVLPAVSLAFNLSSTSMVNGLLSAATLRSGGSSFMRFGVAQNQEALLRITGPSGKPLASGVRLTVVRTR
ncbi:MAG: Ig-like domain-containing protein [Gemmatimonadaceae bacterium]